MKKEKIKSVEKIEKSAVSLVVWADRYQLRNSDPGSGASFELNPIKI